MTQVLPTLPPHSLTFHSECTAAELPDRSDGRTIVREWTDTYTRISTVHPVYGRVHRGRLRVVAGGWEWTDIAGRRGTHRGDFLDAELALLDRTASLD